MLLHVFQGIRAVSNEPIVDTDREALYEETLQTMAAWGKSIQEFVPQFTEMTYRVEGIDLVKDINAFCEENRIDLVVMGVTGKTDLEKVLIGSSTIRIMKEIHFPLLIIPKDSPMLMPERVLLATDLKDVKQKTRVSALVNLLDNLSAALLVVNVAEKEQPVPTLRKEITALHASLDKYQPEYKYMSDPETAETINAVAVDNHVGLIITLHEQHGRLAALFHKSVSKRLAWHSQVPLLVIPA